MSWLSDETVAHLRVVAELPDFSDTRYRLLRQLGQGGMGVVYEADDLDLDRRVAIKVLATELASPDGAARMQREARIMARLEHPGIVPLHDVGTLADGRVFYAMKLVRGKSLDALLVDRALEPPDAIRLFLRVCEAVAFAHANAIVHCDLKPGNVMVGPFGEVFVMDWGVARLVEQSNDPGNDVETSFIGGTRGYMAPEQEQGVRPTAGADVFALGVMLRALLPEKIGRSLQAICTKATALVPANRYESAGELAAELVRYLDGEPLIAYRENVFQRTGRWVGRNRALVGVALAYLAMRALILFFFKR